jgi:AraC-like DNA-binding protein/CheY-like chemotaxis protein
MARPLMLWFDCTASAQPLDLREQCAKFFEVSCSAHMKHATRDILRLRPKALCFDFDFPDQMRLRIMQTIKRENMGLPILMLTLAHSEALAVWAFRAHVWNYLVKPIPPREYSENLRTLAQIAGSERRMTRAVSRPEPGLPQDVTSHPRDATNSALLPAINYIEKHFHEHLSASEVANLCGMSRFRFSRLFHAAYGVTFQDHLLRCRIKEACRLLEQPNVSITEIGFAVGFNDASYFARIFKRYTSLLPSEYARRAQHASTAQPNASVALASPELLAGVERGRPSAPSQPSR